MTKLIAVWMSLMLLACAALAETPEVGMANPWVETTPEALMETLGLEFTVPEGAENIAYRLCEAEQLAEMTFTLDGMDYTARIKPAAEWEDISGMYYEWDNVMEDFSIGTCTAWEGRAPEGEGTVDLCLWFDAAPGLMYSVSTYGDGDLDGFDLTAIAEMLYAPVQGDA